MAVVGMLAFSVLGLAACGGGSWEDRLKDPEVMDAYRQDARATGTALMDERLDDMARRLCAGWAGESDEAVMERELLNTPAIERSNFFAIATAAHTNVCP
ncbi:MAG: hypothetical protein ABI187_04415 [Ornithinibacter sp.]